MSSVNFVRETELRLAEYGYDFSDVEFVSSSNGRMCSITEFIELFADVNYSITQLAASNLNLSLHMKDGTVMIRRPGSSISWLHKVLVSQ